MPRRFGPYEPEKLSIEEYNKQIEELEAESERRKHEHHQSVNERPLTEGELSDLAWEKVGDERRAAGIVAGEVPPGEDEEYWERRHDAILRTLKRTRE